MALFALDSGGVARQLRRLFAVDAGGVSRLVYRLFLRTTVVTGTNGTSIGFSTVLAIGSIANNTFVDDSAITNTVLQVRWDTTNQVVFHLSAGSNPPNTDATFAELIINGTGFLRSAASYSTGGGSSTWTWAGAALPFSGVGVTNNIYVK